MDIIKILFYTLLAAEAIVACVFAYKLWRYSKFDLAWIIAVILLLESPHFIFPLTAWLAKLDRKKQMLAWSIPLFYLILLVLFSLFAKGLTDVSNMRAVMTGSIFARSATLLFIFLGWKRIRE